MKIKDDGKSFNVERTLHADGRKRLGLLGMRERVEMVGGKFAVESSPSKGTTILAQIPLTSGRTRGGGGKLVDGAAGTKP
jgi:signal transduction histidine kinase